LIEVEFSKKIFLPCYRHLLDSDHDINFLWGGRDAGRTHFVAQKVLTDCMSLDYFRCVLVKKTANSIKDSQWQTIKDLVEQYGLSHLFTFRESPLSIQCVNGNKFIARGCDNAENIKSIKDPTHVWYEEGNQLTQAEFITISTTLRSDKTKIQQWFNFNPESVGPYEDFWLYKTFFQPPFSQGKAKSFTHEWVIEIPNKKPVKLTYQATHTTYKDNKHCTAQRIAFLEQLAIIDPYYYKVYTLGEFGNQNTSDPFVYTYRKEKHLGKVTWDPRLETYLSFDFNINPITCGVYQHTEDWIRGVESIKMDNSDIYKLCEYIRMAYPNAMFIVTGDASGSNSTALVKDNINYYTVIKHELNLGSHQIRVPTVNPPLSENRMLVNTIFHRANITLDEYKCKHLIFDIENVGVNEFNEVDKGSRSNPKKRADLMDGLVYYLSRFHRSYLKV
jgi:hypothetical protein